MGRQPSSIDHSRFVKETITSIYLYIVCMYVVYDLIILRSTMVSVISTLMLDVLHAVEVLVFCLLVV